MVNYGEAIKKPFTDLVKLLIGIVLSLIPIVHWFAKGFILESSGLGKTKISSKMPEWKNWGNLFIKGLLSDIIMLIYMIPAIIVFVVGAGLTILSLIATFFGSTITPEMLTGETSPEVMGQMMSQNWVLALPTLIAAAPIVIFAFILALIAFYVTPIAILSYVKSNKFSEAFSLGSVFKKAFTGNYFIVWIVVLIITAIISWILSFIPIVGTALAWFIMGVMAYSLYGQVYKEV
jgi:hypothetical protein